MAADGITVRVEGAQAAVRAFAGGSGLLSRRVRSSVRRAGAFYQTKVRANASGRTGQAGPSLFGGDGEIGPRVQTGDYRRSISLRLFSDGEVYAAEVFTSAPQGHRLEAGFIGADSLGRTYHSPPLPHFGPPVPIAEQFLFSSLEADVTAVDRSIGGGP